MTIDTERMARETGCPKWEIVSALEELDRRKKRYAGTENEKGLPQIHEMVDDIFASFAEALLEVALNTKVHKKEVVISLLQKTERESEKRRVMIIAVARIFYTVT